MHELNETMYYAKPFYNSMFKILGQIKRIIFSLIEFVPLGQKHGFPYIYGGQHWRRGPWGAAGRRPGPVDQRLVGARSCMCAPRRPAGPRLAKLARSEERMKTC